MPRPVSILDGEGVRKELARLNVNQGEFARELRTSPAFLSRALAGKPLRWDSISRLAFALAHLEPKQ